jgi:AcrR family transcriptional regulator
VRDPRERILRTAYELFHLHGIHPIGVDRITAEAGVAKMTLYRHFRSKDELAVAVLQRHAEEWTHGWLVQRIEQGGRTAAQRLRAIFDAFDEWFARDDYRGCLFINCLLEFHDPESAVGAESAAGLAEVRGIVRGVVSEAGVADPDDLAHRVHMLMTGAIVAASAGDEHAARRAGDMAARALEQSRA